MIPKIIQKIISKVFLSESVFKISIINNSNNSKSNSKFNLINRKMLNKFTNMIKIFNMSNYDNPLLEIVNYLRIN